MTLILLPIMIVAMCSAAHLCSGSRASPPVRRDLEGACFATRTPIGCTDFQGFLSRSHCCKFNGYFVRNPDRGQLFMASLLNVQILPNCEKSCGTDFCEGKLCPQGHYCVMRDHDSICTSDCKCTDAQRRSGPVCVKDGPKYRSLCDMHRASCFENVEPTLIPCKKSGCETIQCSGACYLSLMGRTECVTNMAACDRVIYEPLCGVDNVTYPSPCHMQRAGIERGREIHVAYKGLCKAGASCSNVQCPEDGQTCVKHHSKDSPVCVKCPGSMNECYQDKYQGTELFCLNIDRQTTNPCLSAFLSCERGEFVEIVHSGFCLQRTPETPLPRVP